LVERAAEAERAASLANVVLFGGMGIAFLLLCGAFYLALRETGRRSQVEYELDQVFAVSADMLCIAGFDGYFKRLSPAWERTLGYPVRELLTRPWTDFVHPDDVHASQVATDGVEGGGTVTSFENRYRAKDGTYRWLLWTSTLIPSRGLSFGVARDMTAQKLQAEERERLIAELKEALANVKTLGGLLPLCAYCKKIRDDQHYWQTLETYVGARTNAQFSHGICPSCVQRLESGEALDGAPPPGGVSSSVASFLNRLRGR